MLVALAGFVLVAIWSVVFAIRGTGASHAMPGELPAIALFLMACGFAAAFPSMLTDGSGEGVSAMRVVVFVLGSIFSLRAVKTGWEEGRRPEISGTWASLLAAAFGGKVFQSFAESMQRKTDEQKKS